MRHPRRGLKKTWDEGNCTVQVDATEAGTTVATVGVNVKKGARRPVACLSSLSHRIRADLCPHLGMSLIVLVRQSRCWHSDRTKKRRHSLARRGGIPEALPWLECPDTPVHPPYTRAVRILMLTGQLVEEIARLHVDQWDAKECIIDWSKTKNGKPHAIPVPEIAAELIESIRPNAHGWFFPSAMDPTKPVSHGTLYSFMWRQRCREVIPVVTNRDLRRAWKTLAGKAGLSKEIRHRIQNHTLQDVSSRSYDRWNYMPEKRAAMKKWNSFVKTLLSKKRLKVR